MTGCLSVCSKPGFRQEPAGSIVGSSLPVAENMTYVLRSTSNKRADVLVGFRVVRVEENGSLTLIWRKLKVYPKPSWKRRIE